MNKYEKYLIKFEKNIDVYINLLIDWMKKTFAETHADGVVLGMSGGLDCSVVAVLCKMANIPVQLISMPIGNSMNGSPDKNVKALSDKFDFNVINIDISKISNEVQLLCETALDEDISANKCKGNISMANANIGPIARMMILSTLAQYKNFVMIGTGNLTERTMGYFTKRGDGLSDFNPLGELTKSEIRIIAKHIGIPQRIIDTPPSANLWKGQTDEEEMGVLIRDIDRLILTNEGEAHIVEKIKKAYGNSKHKRNSIPIFERRFIYINM